MSASNHIVPTFRKNRKLGPQNGGESDVGRESDGTGHRQCSISDCDSQGVS